MKNGPSARQRSLTAGVQQHDFGLEALSQDVMQIPFGINERSEARGPDHHHTSQLAVLFFCFLDPYPGQASPGREKLNQASAGCYRSVLPVPDAPADVVEGENEEERHRYFYRDERSEEHTSELQSRLHLVCRLLLEKKKKRKSNPSQRTPVSRQQSEIT